MLPLFKVKYARTKAKFRALCTGFNIPLCPHLRLNDDKIMQQFPPKRFPLGVNPVQRPEKYAECDFCKTELRLMKHLLANGVWIQLGIVRYIGDLSSPRDPTWIAQTYAEEDPRLDDYYDAADAWVRDGCTVSERPVHLEPESGSFFTLSTLPELPPAPPPKVNVWDKVWSFFGGR